jgi:hypothetical protein
VRVASSSSRAALAPAARSVPAGAAHARITHQHTTCTPRTLFDVVAHHDGGLR